MQFDVYRNDNSATRAVYPYLLDVQADLLETLGTRLVVPLRLQSDLDGKSLKGLMPDLEIAGESYLAMVPQMASVARTNLRAKVSNAGEKRGEILAALDLLFTGV